MSPRDARGTQPTGRASLERAHANHLEAFRALARVLPGGRIAEDSEALFIRTGLPAADFNVVYVSRRPADPRRIAGRMRTFFEGWDGPRRIVATPEAASEMRPAAERLGLAPADDVPLMILDPLDRPTTPVPEGVTIDLVEDVDTLRTYFFTGAEGYGAPKGAFDPVAGHDDVLAGILADPCWTNYVARLEGRPVATGFRYTSHRVAGIYFVSTLPAHRGRGIGGAITLRAALDGAREGCTISALQATKMGFPVYERLGYRTAYRYAVWESGASPASGGPARVTAES